MKIHEAGTLDRLTKLLPLSTPEIQRNAIKTLSLLMECHQARAGLLEANGIMPVVDLLQSEYAIIQVAADM